MRNAINTETAQRLHDAFLAFEADPDARVAVLTGDDTAFCAGANLKDLPASGRAGRSAPPGFSSPSRSSPRSRAGASRAASSSRLVRPARRGATARFGCLERRWGVPLIDGGTYRLPRIVGLGRALDLILTGREFDADEALAIGFVNRVVPAAARSTLRSSSPSRSLRSVARVVHDRLSVYESIGLDLDDALANEERHGDAVIFDPAFADGVARFQDRAR